MIIGNNNAGGSIAGAVGSTFTIGSGAAGQTLAVGLSSGTLSNGALNLSAAASLPAAVRSHALARVVRKPRLGNV